MCGEVATALKPHATGRYENAERCSKFSNIPALLSRVRQFMDALSSNHLATLVKRPDIGAGKPDLLVVLGSALQKQYMETMRTPRLEGSRK
jgi:N12 class adenine-specific DNA methylase